MNRIQCLGLGKRFSKNLASTMLFRMPRWGKARGSDLFWALHDIHLTVSGSGKWLGIVGANGSGKTTLLRIIAGVTQPTQGTVIINGRVVPVIELYAGLQPELSGRENVYLNGVILGMRRREIRRKLESIVEFAGARRFLDMQLKHYSSGMVLRLAFSIASHVDAEIILLDEAWSAADAEFYRKSIERLKQLKRQGATTVLVSHDLDVVRQLADDVAWLSGGRLVKVGPTDSTLKAYVAAMNEPHHNTS